MRTKFLAKLLLTSIVLTSVPSVLISSGIPDSRQLYFLQEKPEQPPPAPGGPSPGGPREGTSGPGGPAPGGPRKVKSPAEGAAEITSVSHINPKAWQTIVIKGKHFGAGQPYNGCSDFLRVLNLTDNSVFGWFAPGRFCYSPILVSSWTDTEIDIDAFPSFKRGQDAFKVGDIIKIQVANPNQAGWVTDGKLDNFGGAPVAWYSVRVTPERTEPPVPKSSAPEGNIRAADFRNFSYTSDCSNEMGDGSDKVIRVSNGEWVKGRVEDGDMIGFSVAKIVYGDLKGDGSEEAVVATSCSGMANFDYEELFIFEMSAGSPKLLVRLTPSDWGRKSPNQRFVLKAATGDNCSGPNCPILELSVANRQLAVGVGVGGSHACPEWIVTQKLQWNGHQFVRAGSDRKAHLCH